MRVLAFACVLVPCALLAQNHWLDVGIPDTFNIALVNSIYSDPVADQLLVMGYISFTNDLAFELVPYLEHSVWGYYGVFNYGAVNSVLRYGDTLLFAGNFESVDTFPIAKIAARVNGEWLPFGDFSANLASTSIRKLRIVNGTLYALGYFQYLDGHECWGVAKREGGQWVNLGERFYTPTNGPIVGDICEYQGKMVVGGEFGEFEGLAGDLIQYNGATWENVGNGVQGCIGWIGALEVYHDELYVGGGLYESAGAAGHGLVRWNGSEWNDVGGGMRDIYNTTNYNASASSFLVHDDKLFVGGAFGYAGGLEANQFAIWDGSSWCVTGDSIGTLVTAMAVYHDTLFVNCEDQLPSGPANFVARWSGGTNLADTCVWAVGVEESKPIAHKLICSFDPSTNSLFVQTGLSVGTERSLVLSDALGRSFYEDLFPADQRLKVGQLPAGLYAVRLVDRRTGVAGSCAFVKP